MTALSLRSYLFATFILLMAELLSYLGFVDPALGSALFLVIIAAVVLLAWRKLETALLVLFAELFVGGKGYLFSMIIGNARISLRIAIFCVVLLMWFLFHRGEGNPYTRMPKIVRWWLAFLGVTLIIGVISGLLNHHGFSAVYFDANAFLFLLLAPVLFSPAIVWNRWMKSLLTVVAAAATILGLKSLISLGVFAHLDIGQLKTYYRWIRITGVGEIAYINGNNYRVFFQSQIYGLFGVLLLAPLLLPTPEKQTRKWWLLLPLILGTTAILISLSRSFWMGAIVAMVFGLGLGWKQFHWTVQQIFFITTAAVCTLGIAYTLTSWALNFPYPFPPARGSKTANLIGQRFTAIGGEAAVSSRINELKPLQKGILKNPLIGSGFGTELTYTSNDPRQIKSQTKGRYTTYAFEWGYLDFILKVGLLGLIAYLGLLWSLGTQLWQARTNSAFGLLLGLVSLIVIHITTPYLNHPLGIGLVLLGLGFGQFRTEAKT